MQWRDNILLLFFSQFLCITNILSFKINSGSVADVLIGCNKNHVVMLSLLWNPPGQSSHIRCCISASWWVTQFVAFVTHL